MRRGILTFAVCAALLGIFVLGRWAEMYGESGNFNQFTVFLNDLSERQPPSIDWRLFRNWDFPTGKCENILVDVSMFWIGLILLGLAGVSALWVFRSGRTFRAPPPPRHGAEAARKQTNKG